MRRRGSSNSHAPARQSRSRPRASSGATNTTKSTGPSRNTDPPSAAASTARMAPHQGGNTAATDPEAGPPRTAANSPPTAKPAMARPCDSGRGSKRTTTVQLNAKLTNVPLTATDPNVTDHAGSAAIPSNRAQLDRVDHTRPPTLQSGSEHLSIVQPPLRDAVVAHRLDPPCEARGAARQARKHLPQMKNDARKTRGSISVARRGPTDTLSRYR